jgi:3-oxoacyl-[acyl-carrier protein] reductase
VSDAPSDTVQPGGHGIGGRAYLVTGGTRGIGYAIAEVLLREGASVAICGRDAETCRRAGESLGSGAAAFVADVRSDEEVRRLVATASSPASGASTGS